MNPKSKSPTLDAICPASVLRQFARVTAFLVGSLCIPGQAGASSDSPKLSPDAVEIRPANRRVELRKALESNLQHDKAQDRRKLSQEEREALHRDLRAIMRNVNADYDDGRK